MSNFPANEQEIRDCLKNGTPINFLPFPDDRREAQEDRARRTIKAEWIKELVKGPENIVDVDIFISNAIIQGPINLSFSEFRSQISINNSIFLDKVDISSSKFSRTLDISNSTFNKNFNVRFSKINYEFIISGASFNEGASFEKLCVEQSLIANGVYLKDANFDRMAVSKNISFRPLIKNDELIPARFDGSANFIHCSVTGYAHFNGAVFNGDCDFEHILLDGAEFNCFVHNDQALPCRFLGEVKFRNAVFNRTVQFDGTQFEKDADFSAMRCDSYLLFRSFDHLDHTIPTRFGGNARFFYVSVERNLVIRGSTFEKETNFERLSVKGSAFFTPWVKENDITPVNFKGNARFFNVYIEGDMNFEGAKFQSAADFEGAVVAGNTLFRTFNHNERHTPVKFDKKVRFMRARLNGTAEFQGAIFNDSANFRFIKIGGSALFGPRKDYNELLRTTFNGSVDFYKASFENEASFDGVIFVKEAIFSYAHFGGNSSFISCYVDGKFYPTTFRGNANFRGAKFDGELRCNGAQFQEDADFHSIHVQERADFGSNFVNKKQVFCNFGKKAFFEFARFGNNCFFRSTQFEGEAYFNNAQVSGDIQFSSTDNAGNAQPVNFHKKASFRGCTVEKNAVFRGTRFHGAAEFERCVVKRNFVFETFVFNSELYQVVFFNKATFAQTGVFGELNFRAVNFQGKAFFNRVTVSGNCSFNGFSEADNVYKTTFDREVDFYNAKFGDFDFCDVQLKQKVNFTAVNVQGLALFHRTVFEDVVLREADFSRANFSEDKEGEGTEGKNTQFQGKVDLVGFSYNRIEVNWSNLLDRIAPFDRQPFTYLENTYRSQGHDIYADEVYLKRRKRESNVLWSKLLGKDALEEIPLHTKIVEFIPAIYRNKNLITLELPLIVFDLTERWLFNYGIRPFRLLFISIVVILIGLFVFIQPNSVIYKDPRLRTADVIQLSSGGALNVSLNQFVPIIEIPPGSEWKPSSEPAPLLGYIGISFAGYAMLHRLAGFLLIPLGIAALTGRLYRKGK